MRGDKISTSVYIKDESITSRVASVAVNISQTFCYLSTISILHNKYMYM